MDADRSTTRQPDPARPETAPIAPHEVIWGLAHGFVASRCLHVIATLGVADEIGEDPVSTPELASRCGADADALGRLLRLLAAHGIFECAGEGFRHTPASRLLCSDHPMSMRAFAELMGLPLFTATFARLEHSARTGSPAIDTVEPRGPWAYFHDHPDEELAFGHAMTAKAAADIAAVLGAYDFSGFARIADIGGGRGHLLRAILDAAPEVEGVLFDRPEVIAAVHVDHDRLTPQAGDFFVGPLPVADAYLLMDVLHDWPDAECVAILRAIRTAAGTGAKVLVMESTLPENGGDPAALSADIVMLAMTGGRERTAHRLGELFASSSFGEPTVIPTDGRLRIVEATAM